VANKQLFQSFTGKLIPDTDAYNGEHAPAYALAAAHALAQYAATGCLNGTFYASAAEQLAAVLALCDAVPAADVAKTAVFARTRGFMKDMPALLCAYLSVADAALCERVFDRVIDDGKMLRTFVQILRSGVVGRKSLGSMPKRLVQRWFAQRSDEQIFRASVGQDPSLADVIALAHPRPETASRRALFAYLIGRPYDYEALPELVRAFEHYKQHGGPMPDVPFQMLTALELGRDGWAAIARQATWTQTRMSLATFARHGVFQLRHATKLVAERLRDAEQIRRARVLPYQLLTACLATGHDVPPAVRDALEDAMEIALANVPVVRGRVYVCCDVSGSMASPVTGYRAGATTKMRCIDVAGLVAAAMMRTNDAEVLPFEERVVPLRLSRRDSVLSNARKLAAIGGGGTNCSAPLAELNARGATGSLVLYVSDNESWIDAGGGRGTEMMRQWQRFRGRNPRASLVCIDLAPNRTSQAPDGEAILNVGGFSDAVFELVSAFVSAGGEARHWSDVIAQVTL
jgi:60 kDa SS-A/Ro ribonucleoprotein